MNPILRRATRVVSLATVVTVACASIVAAPTYAAPDATTPGAAWLGGELERGLIHDTQFDFADYGLSIDTALALSALGKDRQARKVTKAVAAHVGSYTTGADFGTTDVYAGPTAKAAVLALDQGRDPASFGGVDLVAQLEGLVQASGRIADRSEFGDFANVVGQAYAARALSEVRSPKARAALSFLVSQQCSQGYFRLSFGGDDSCDDAARSARRPDTDATSHAVAALSRIKGARAERALTAAVRWLKREQAGNGSFGGGTTTEKPNTNSTGLAGTALAVAGEETRAARAAAYVRGFQVVAVDGCATELDDEAGAIAYDKSAWRAGEKDGVTDETRGQWRRASAQALPVLRWAPEADGALAASGRSVPGGVRLTLSGVAPGERVCVIGGGERTWVVGRGSRVSVKVDAPDAGSATYRVVNGDGTSARVQVSIG